MNETQNYPQDISRQAHSLARIIDRLKPDEKYVIRLKKSVIKDEAWDVVISIEQTVTVRKIWKRDFE